MRKRKGLLAAALAVAMMGTVCGCGVNVTTENSAAGTTKAEIAETSANASNTAAAESEKTDSDEQITCR